MCRSIEKKLLSLATLLVKVAITISPAYCIRIDLIKNYYLLTILHGLYLCLTVVIPNINVHFDLLSRDITRDVLSTIIDL